MILGGSSVFSCGDSRGFPGGLRWSRFFCVGVQGGPGFSVEVKGGSMSFSGGWL